MVANAESKVLVVGSCLVALLAILVFNGSPSSAEDSGTTSPEAQRFEAAKARAMRAELENYLLVSKNKVDQAWQHWTSAAHGKLLVTKVKMKVASNGKFDASTVGVSGSVVEDQVVLDCLKSVSLSQLPSSVENFEIYLTLMSDGSLNMTEFTDSAEANDYNVKTIGVTVLPAGGFVIHGRSGNAGPFALMPVAGGASLPLNSLTYAINYWEEAVRENPLSPENHIGLGQAFVNHGEFGQARQEYLQAIRLSPGKNNPTANKLLAGLPAAQAAAIALEHVDADVDYGPYMADLQRRIKRAWFPPKGNESKRVVVTFRILKDGGLAQNVQVDHSSGVPVADEAAIKAVSTASFRPLPAGSKDSVDLQYTFDYNVFNGGGVGKFTRF